MKRTLIFGAALVLLIALGASDALAAPGALQEPNTAANGLLALIQNNAQSWNGRLHGYAVSLFWALAAIQFVITFFPLTIRGADFGEIVGELVSFILTIGFFAALLMYSAQWAQALIDSFRQAGAHAAGLSGSGLNPGDMFATAVELADTITSAQTWNPGTALAIAASGLVVLICFAFIAAFMFVTLVESYIVINASVLFMGFGGSKWTRDYALATLRYAVAVGAKLFVLTLIVGLIIQSASQWQAAYNNDDASMLTMVGLSLVCAYLAKSIPDLIQGMISGASPGGGAAIGTMAAAALTGGAAGAAAVGAAGAAGAASAAGGATGNSGLAGAIDASVSGMGNMAPSALGGLNGSEGGANSLSPRIGGGASASPLNGQSAATLRSSGGLRSSGPSAARIAGGAAGSAQNGQTTRTQQSGQATRQAAMGGSGRGTEGTSSSPVESTTAAPALAEGGSSAGESSPGATALSSVASGITAAGHVTAKLASISVPGMEGMAGGIQTLPPSGQDSAEDRPFKGDDVAASTNTIMPASTKAHPVPPTQEIPQPSAAQPPKE